VDIRGDYISEVETRLTVTTPVAGLVHLSIVAGFMTTTESILLNLISDGTQCWIGLVASDYADLSAYQAVAPIDLLGNDLHVRLVVDRDPTPGSGGQLTVWVNYQETPVLQISYVDFMGTGWARGLLFFGPFIESQATVKVDYFAHQHYKKRSGAFKGWSEWCLGTNEVVSTNIDPDIVQPLLVNPPGVTIGQSHNCCVLEVQDPTLACSIAQTTVLLSTATYQIGLDYKCVGRIPFSFELVVQRVLDLWYWDQAVGNWVATYASVVVPISTVRIRATGLITGLQLATSGAVIVSVQSTIAAVTVHQILVYKVMLAEE
jgi:hypothetical protein